MIKKISGENSALKYYIGFVANILYISYEKVKIVSMVRLRKTPIDAFFGAMTDSVGGFNTEIQRRH